MSNFKKKYLKYKLKYEKLKQLGGEFDNQAFNDWFPTSDISPVAGRARARALFTKLNETTDAIENLRRSKINLLVENFAKIQTFNPFKNTVFYTPPNTPHVLVNPSPTPYQPKSFNLTDTSLKVMQYNIEHNGFTSNNDIQYKVYNRYIKGSDSGASETTVEFTQRLDLFIDTVEQEQPDIIGLNEIGVYAYKYITKKLKDIYEIYVGGFPIHINDYDNKDNMKRVLYELSFKNNLNVVPSRPPYGKNGAPLDRTFLLSFVDEINDEYEIENMYFNVCLIKKNIEIIDSTCYYFNNLNIVHRRNTLLSFQLRYKEIDFLWTHSHFIYGNQSQQKEKKDKLRLLQDIVTNSGASLPIIITGDFYTLLTHEYLENLGIEYNRNDTTYFHEWADCVGLKNFKNNKYVIQFGNDYMNDRKIFTRSSPRPPYPPGGRMPGDPIVIISDHSGLVYNLNFVSQVAPAAGEEDSPRSPARRARRVDSHVNATGAAGEEDFGPRVHADTGVYIRPSHPPHRAQSPYDKLLEYGFDSIQIKNALLIHNNNFHQAFNWLLNQ